MTTTLDPVAVVEARWWARTFPVKPFRADDGAGYDFSPAPAECYTQIEDNLELIAASLIQDVSAREVEERLTPFVTALNEELHKRLKAWAVQLLAERETSRAGVLA